MGTRGLTVVVSDGVNRVAQYGQWDHYPRGQGRTALAFCREHLSNDNGRAVFKEKLKLTRFISDEEHKKLWGGFGVDISSGFVAWDAGKAFGKLYPSLSRDTGAQILSVIMNAEKEVPLQDEFEFGADGLFCEWAWVIDLDKKVLEAYKGFSKEPAVGRFAHLTPSAKAYQPISLDRAFLLDDLPSEETFLKSFGEDGE